MTDEQKQKTADAQEIADSLKNEEIQESAQAEDAQQDEQIIEDEEIIRLKTELESKDKLIQEHIDRVKRLQADFDNFRRRTRQEKEELSGFVIQNLIKELLPMLDNFERALAADISEDNSSFKNGIDMIYKQLFSILEKNGLETIQAVGEKFDPNFHEAVMRVADDTKEDDTVAEELQRGYLVSGRVIRPSMVKVVGN